MALIHHVQMRSSLDMVRLAYVMDTILLYKREKRIICFHTLLP